MKTPYNQLNSHGEIVFAARAGKIHTFNLLDGSHISSWKHPEADAVNTKDVVEVVGEEADEESAPPAKRQKKSEDDEDETATPAKDTAPPKHNSGKQKSRRGKAPQRNFVPDTPVITHLASTSNGSHLVVITGHDKTIWVLEHDGNGHLKQLSSRAMPKRPSSLAVSSDTRIICGDKFGDVYALPLVLADSETPKPAAVAAPSPVTKPSANVLTVHSKRNRAALQNQLRQMELRGHRGAARSKDGPDFELDLLLGHVSMLTVLTLVEVEGRGYILTADRDEHIRVSRYIPQAHVIEGFCLGHEQFVNALEIPRSRLGTLISGGGDSDLFVWDWVKGTLLSRAGVLSLAQEILPSLSQVAVSHLCSLEYHTPEDSLTFVLAICEDIKAVFAWQLTEGNTLKHPSVIQLPGNPLHLIAKGGQEGGAPRLAVALDPGEAPAKGLHVFTLKLDSGRLVVDTDETVRDADLEALEPEVTETSVRELLYSVENLRKQTGAVEEPKTQDEEDEMVQDALTEEGT